MVEAAWRSGALNTLSWASGLGKVAMAVPGPVTTVGSLGCHERIRNGEAQLVTSGEEIRGLLSSAYEVDSQLQYELSFAATPIQGLSRNELRVFDCLGTHPKDATELATDAGMRLPLVIHLLIELQKKSLVLRDGRCWLRAKI